MCARRELTAERVVVRKGEVAMEVLLAGVARVVPE